MKKQNEPFDNWIGEQFKNTEIEPSAGIWKGIERELDREQIFKKRWRIASWSLAASVFLCALFTGIYFNKPRQQTLAYEKIPASTEPAKQKIQKTPEIRLEQPGKKELIRKKDLAVKTLIPIQAKSHSKPAIKPVENKEEAIPVLPADPVLAKEVKEEPVMLAEVSQELPKMPVPASLKPSTGSKETVSGMVGVVNYLAGKVSKEDTKLITINHKSPDANTRVMSYNVDLGFVKISRVKHHSN